EQFAMANRLYNDIVAAMRTITDDARAHTISLAGGDAGALAESVEKMTEQFLDAKAKQDEGRMRAIAFERRAARGRLYQLLGEARKTNRAVLIEKFWSRIGNKVGTETYRLRGDAVKAGLGWATANATLAAALTAQKKSAAAGGGVPHFRR